MAMNPELPNQIGVFLATALTLIVLSYTFRDNPVFRVILYLFVGVSAGYAAAIIVQDVVFPQLVYPVLDELTGVPTLDVVDLVVRVVLSVLLLSKLSPRIARLGSPVTALLAGVGAALAIGGAVQGTLIPQIGSAATIFNTEGFQQSLLGGYYSEVLLFIFEGFILLLATVSTLAYFHFGAKDRGKQAPQRNIVVDGLAWIGAIFIAIALAALFNGVLQAALGALIERIDFLRSVVSSLIGIP
jgi:hypothetical protein